jgi:hypothetical protein
MTSYGYSSIPGSERLKTAPRGEDDEVAALEALDPSATAGRWVHGEWLCRVVVREGAVAVLDDVFDRLLPLHEAEEAAVYLQLYRLSYGHERNWCRTSRSALRARANLSDRRLGGALAGLVEKDHIRQLHRDRQGTLYRVRLPFEIFREPDHDRVFSARPSSAAKKASKTKKKPAKRAPEPSGNPAAGAVPGPKESENNTLSKSSPSDAPAPRNQKRNRKRGRLQLPGALSGASDEQRRGGGVGVPEDGGERHSGRYR